MLLTGFSIEQKAILNDSFSHFFVDEAHHSEADTWKELIEKFKTEKVILFTATPFRNDGKSLQGKVIFSFSLRKAQEQIASGDRCSDSIRKTITDVLDSEPLFKTDYVETVDGLTMKPVNELRDGDLVAMAVWVRKTRLIDNFIVGDPLIEFK